MIDFYRKIITASIEAFPLEGCVNPTFQNEGENSVLIDGINYETGESFSIRTDGQPFSSNNNIPIVFSTDEKQKNKLVFRCTKITPKSC